MFKHVLTNSATNTWESEVRLDPQACGLKLAGSADWAVSKYALKCGRAAGVDVVEVNNGCLSLSILPTRGMGIWHGVIQGTRIGWNSPVELPVNPAFVDLNDRDGLGWLDGFNELLCRCGLGWNGPPGADPGAGNRTLTLHGRIANRPAHYVDVIVDESSDSISVTGHVDETMMFDSRLRLESTVILKAGDSGFTVRDTVRNLGGTPAEMQLLYHTNIGAPFLQAGGRVAASCSEIAPRDARAAEGIAEWNTYTEPVAGYAEQVYYLRPEPAVDDRAVALLHNAAGDRGISLKFDPATLPCLAIWKNTQLPADGCVTGLEPATNYPNFRAYEREQNRVVNLAPGATWSTEIEFRVHSAANEIDEILQTISHSEPTIHSDPAPGFST